VPAVHAQEAALKAVAPFALSATLLASPLAGAGPTFTVNSTGDAVDSTPGDGVCETAKDNATCTLRAAVMEANHWSDATIVVPPMLGPYTLNITRSGLSEDAATGDLDVLADMTIVGGGASTTVVDASTLGDRILAVGSGHTLTISGLTLRNGRPSPSSEGGAALVHGTLHISDCVVTGCWATYGGGFYIPGGAVTITRCVIDQNSASYSAGGIDVADSTVTITSSTISRNVAAEFGGGIDVVGTTTLTIVGSSIWGNRSIESGGGIHTWSSPITAKIVDSTISGNSAGENGGGISSEATGTTALYSVTVAANEADSYRTGAGRGGGVWNAQGSVFTFVDTIIATNSETLLFNGTWYPVDGDCTGPITSQGYSLLRNFDTQHCDVAGTYTLTDPNLGDLGDNGGRTLTHALLAGSPAIDAGDPTGCKDPLAVTLATDQRGAHRALGAHCDIGAYESGSPKGDVDGDGIVNVADVFYLINYLFAAGPYPPGIANVNGDSAANVADVFYLINYLFAGGPGPV
jgi:CSLREA domain-containing protein